MHSLPPPHSKEEDSEWGHFFAPSLPPPIRCFIYPHRRTAICLRGIIRKPFHSPRSSLLPALNRISQAGKRRKGEKEGSDFLCHLFPLSLLRFVILNAHPLSAHLQSNSPLRNRVHYVVYVYTYPPPPLSISPMQSVTTTLPLSLPSKHGNFLRPLSTLHKPPLSGPPMSVFLPPEKAPSRKRVPRKKLGEVKGGKKRTTKLPTE